MKHDLLIRGATLVNAENVRTGDVAVSRGRIAAIGDSLDLPATRVVEARGRYLLPGFIDANVRFHEPGGADREGLLCGSSALAAGGGTAFIDLPFGCSPPVLDAAAFAAKAAAIEKNSVLDAAIWGGLVPGNIANLRELAQCGVIGFAACMSSSGDDAFPAADPAMLREGMKIAAELRLPVAVHAEDDAIIAKLTRAAREGKRIAIADYLHSRPISAELEAIGQAVEIALQTGCALHVLNVSTCESLELIAAARTQGCDVTAETCPHYLLLTENDALRLGGVAKCAPPLRSSAEVSALWRAIGDSLADTIGSAHSPAPPELKEGADFFALHAGISSCQHTLSLFFEAAVMDEHFSPTMVVRLTASNVARRFRLAGKGDLAEGYDADMVLLDTKSAKMIWPDDLLYRHRHTPYLGRTARVAVVETWSRGETVFPRSANKPQHQAEVLRPAQV